MATAAERIVGVKGATLERESRSKDRDYLTLYPGLKDSFLTAFLNSSKRKDTPSASITELGRETGSSV